ncbi:hypothetical protein [uncultured Psychrobacter sp.]|uniref:hypothetical protein n=1 Tax=unclassified Psychrobacter TaxID=196806 RepID=UPI00293D2663|nr:hypothetical protein [uncultured Psychrobacter sp.]
MSPLSPAKLFLKLSSTFILCASTIALSQTANAGFFDSIYDVQRAVSSIGQTADTFRGSKQAVTDLGEEVGFISSNEVDNQVGGVKLIEGALLAGKLKNTSLYNQASNNSMQVSSLSQQDTIIYMGKEQNGYYYVQTDKGAGWVSKPLVGLRY